MPHIDDAYRLAHWLTGNRTDAEDVVQDASLRAFGAIRQFAGGSARSWLLSIVRNTAYSWLRKNRPTAVITEIRASYAMSRGSRGCARQAKRPERRESGGSTHRKSRRRTAPRGNRRIAHAIP